MAAKKVTGVSNGGALAGIGGLMKKPSATAKKVAAAKAAATTNYRGGNKSVINVGLTKPARAKLERQVIDADKTAMRARMIQSKAKKSK